MYGYLRIMSIEELYNSCLFHFHKTSACMYVCTYLLNFFAVVSEYCQPTADAVHELGRYRKRGGRQRVHHQSVRNCERPGQHTTSLGTISLTFEYISTKNNTGNSNLRLHNYLKTL